MKLYKLTDSRLRTQNGFQWVVGQKSTARRLKKGEKPKLCSDTVLHAYTSPLLAVAFNPIHASYQPALLWEASGKIAIQDGTNIGCRSLTLIRQMDLPKISTAALAHWAILCAQAVYKNPDWAAWAKNWLSKKDRTVAAAKAAYTANAANAAYIAYTAYTAAYTAYAAYAAYAAAEAAYTAYTAKYNQKGSTQLDLETLLIQAIEAEK